MEKPSASVCFFDGVELPAGGVRECGFNKGCSEEEDDKEQPISDLSAFDQLDRPNRNQKTHLNH